MSKKVKAQPHAGRVCLYACTTGMVEYVLRLANSACLPSFHCSTQWLGILHAYSYTDVSIVFVGFFLPLITA